MDYAEHKKINNLKNDVDYNAQTWKKNELPFLKIQFICEFTLISNTSKSNSIR